MEKNPAYLRNRRGQALVEMAIVIPVLLLLLASILDLGRVMHDYLTISYAAREGARAAAVGATNEEILTAINNASPSVQITHTPIIDPATDRKRNVPVTVTINHEVAIVTPLISSIVSNPFPVKAVAVMRVE